MTKTKDELIDELQYDCEILLPLDVSTDDAVDAGFKHGCLKMYDHRQKEIDELNRFWAHRWMVVAHWICSQVGVIKGEDLIEIMEEMDEAAQASFDAAASRVMEVKE